LSAGKHVVLADLRKENALSSRYYFFAR